MAIVIQQSFDVQAAVPIDSRILLNKAKMALCSTPNTDEYDNMPARYFIICIQPNDPDDGKLFLYDKSATPDPEYGLFKEVNADVSGDIADIESQVSDLNDQLAGKQEAFLEGEGIELTRDSEGRLVLNAVIDTSDLSIKIPGALKEALAAQTENSGLYVDENGNIGVALDDEYLKLNASNEITFTDFIIQSVVK